MRIFLDQAVYDQRNKGNVALLQAAVNRFSRLWPDVTIEVLTEAPHLLRLYCPTVFPVSVHPWQNWSPQRDGREVMHRRLPGAALHLPLELREEMWHRFPALFSTGLRKSIMTRIAGGVAGQPTEGNVESELTGADLGSGHGGDWSLDFLQAIQNADLVVATGGGYLCDTDKEHTLQVFDTLEMAVQLGKPAGMVGQGVGPLRDPDLRARLSNLLPSLDFILVREPKIARPLLDSLGVASDRVITTGDDAIEMAYEARPAGWGNYIGVNLRTAHYTEVGRTYVARVRPALFQVARRYGVPLMALPISSHVREGDLEVIRELLRGYEHVSIDWQRFDQPLNVIRKVGRCRAVVTGAFHPAVFALAQGIPVVGLVKSEAYIDKFSALRDEFGPACQILNLDDEQLEDKLITAIDRAWTSAEDVRPGLLQAAVRQIEWGNAGYQRLYELVAHRQNAYSA